MPKTPSRFQSLAQNRAFNFWLDLLFRPTCKVCGREGDLLCDFCASSLRLKSLQLCAACQKPAPNGVTHAACAKRYGLDGMLVAGVFSQLRDLVHAYKYENHKNLSRKFGGLLAKFLDGFSYLEYFSTFELVPVPLHKKRQRFRGFNQSELLAESLSNQIPLNLKKNLLARIRDTETQTHFNREARLQNLKDAFALSDGQAAANGRFLLIDDVVTTGSTLKECAKTLKKAGADLVWALVLARG